MSKLMKSERNNYIDFLRGIAAIGIIAIHTAFKSGESYTPEWFRSLTLLLDVPFFFYLSGWASSYRKADVKKTLKSIINIWVKWVFFISVTAVICWGLNKSGFEIYGIFDGRDLINNYMFNVSFPSFPVIGESIWFMEYYFAVVLINTLIMFIIEKSELVDENKKVYMLFLAVAFVWTVYGRYTLGLELIYLLFYSFFWMLGMNRVGKTKNMLSLFVIIAIILCLTGLFSELQMLNWYDLQTAKFPPSLKYGVVSLLSIFILKRFEGIYKGKLKLIEHIGKNAIFYYFGQGIGSSFLYYIIGMVTFDNWFITWVVAVLINIVITIIVSEILAFIFKYVYRGVNGAVEWMKKISLFC